MMSIDVFEVCIVFNMVVLVLVLRFVVGLLRISRLVLVCFICIRVWVKVI